MIETVHPLGMMAATIAARAATITQEATRKQATTRPKATQRMGVNLSRTFMNSRRSVIRTRTAREGNQGVAREAKPC